MGCVFVRGLYHAFFVAIKDTVLMREVEKRRYYFATKQKTILYLILRKGVTTKMKRQILKGVAILTLAMSAMLVLAVSATATDWTSTNSLPNAAGTYQLMTDVDLGSKRWDVPEGETTLDLNGHGITSSNSRATIYCDADGLGRGFTLNITDSSPNTPHTLDGISFKGGYITGNGIGVRPVSNSRADRACTFNMNGGNIINAGGGGIDGGGKYATVNINGVKISHCADAGIWLDIGATVNIKNSEISYCGIDGVRLDNNSGALNISSSTISNNGDCGVYYEGTELEIDNCNITGNGNNGVYCKSTTFTMSDTDVLRNGDLENYSEDKLYGVWVNASESVNIDSCNVNNNNGTGIQCKGSCDAELRDSTMNYNSYYGLSVANSNSNVDMYDCDIIGNSHTGLSVYRDCRNIVTAKVKTWPGGIDCDGSGTFIIDGSIDGVEISGNKGIEYGGVWFGSNVDFKVSGTVVIKDNAFTDGTPMNVGVYTGNVIVIDGTLNNDSQIGVAPYNNPTVEKPIIVTSGLEENGSLLNFTSDDTDYLIIEDEETGEAKLMLDPDAPETAVEIIKVLATDKGYNPDGTKDDGATAFIARITKLVNREVKIRNIEWNITPSDKTAEPKVFTQKPNVTLTKENRVLNIALVIGDLFDKDAKAEITIK